MNEFLYMEKAAREIGIHRVTLCRLEKEGKVPTIPRDRNGNRLFTPELIQEFRKILFPERFSTKKK